MGLRSSLAVVILLLGSLTLHAVEIMDPSQLKAGDEGVFVTEVDGGELLRSPIRVLGVLGGSLPGGEMVLIRLLAPRFEKTGVAAGMSGSPVYVRGRLVGALAFGWNFASAPIAGVTPFSRMVEDVPPETMAAPSGRKLPELRDVAVAIRDQGIIQQARNLLQYEGDEGPTPLPFSLGTAGVLSSFRPEGWLGKLFQGMGWVLAPGGAGVGGPDSPETKMRPGSMVAAVLVDGDAHLAAGGTVTEIRDHQVWAFGHPFLKAGPVRMPMARALVVTILPSLASSFKFFNTGERVGAFLSDRSHGIWGLMDQKASMIPLHLKLGDEAFDFSLLDHSLLTPLLTAYLVKGIETVRGVALRPQTVETSLILDFDDGRDLHLSQVFEGADASDQAAAWTAALTAYLKQSSFQGPKMEGISCVLKTTEGRSRRQILDATPSVSVLSPGEHFQLRVRMLAPDGSIEKKIIEIQAPDERASGSLQLVVADGASWAAYDLKSRPGIVHSFAGQLDQLQRLKSASVIVTAFEGAGRSLVTEAGSVPVPAGVLMNLRSARRTQMNTVAWRVLQTHETPVDFPVLGALRLSLRIQPPGFEKGK